MRPDVHRVSAIKASPCEGRVVFAPVKAAWNFSFFVAAVVFAPAAFSLDTILLFAGLTYFTLLFGHSVGMHRYFIHRTYQTHPWLARTLVYLGVVVGMAGPFGILRIHDLRDWAQREPNCHDFFSHRRSLPVDAFWQLFCRFEFHRPPEFEIEAEFLDDPWYQWMERTWMLQQLPLTLMLYLLGGWDWVVWGVFVRVIVSVTGHWIVTYLTHQPGLGRWRVDDAGVQASDLVGYGILTMGECWHNNHHAFPESARIGLDPGQTDPGWWVIRTLQRFGLVWDVGLPRREKDREDISLSRGGMVRSGI